MSAFRLNLRLGIAAGALLLAALGCAAPGQTAASPQPTSAPAATSMQTQAPAT